MKKKRNLHIQTPSQSTAYNPISALMLGWLIYRVPLVKPGRKLRNAHKPVLEALAPFPYGYGKNGRRIIGKKLRVYIRVVVGHVN